MTTTTWFASFFGAFDRSPWEWDYWQWLILVSLPFVLLEQLAPWHRPHRFFRRGWLRDVLFLALNGHFVQLLLGAVLFTTVFDATVTLLASWGFETEAAVCHDWPIWLQVVAFMIVSDFVQWSTHVTLHKVPMLWMFHKVHHSIPRLDWAANFHFHWFEILVYRTTQAIPLAWLGVPLEGAMFVYVFGTMWGHFNHANLPIRIGPLKYIFNSPHMHIWHHDASTEGGTAKNFGIVLSLWDWLFGTAYWPEDREPERLGYPGDEEMPEHFVGQILWPLTRLHRDDLPPPE